MPCIAIRPIAANEAQRYLLRRDGYVAHEYESCVILIKPQCRGVAHDPFRWNDRTMRTAHQYVEKHWDELSDGDVVDVEFVLGEREAPKASERDEEGV